MEPQHSPFPKGFGPSTSLTPLARHEPLPASLATTQPVARRTRRGSSEPLQRWLLIGASITAVGVWSTFGALYYKRHGSTASSRAYLAPTSQDNVSVVIAPPVTAPKPAEPGLAAEGVGAATTKAAALPARAAAAEAAPVAEAPAAKPSLEAPTPKAAAPAGRPRADEATKSAGSAAKARPAVRPRQPGDRASPKKRPIDEGF